MITTRTAAPGIDVLTSQIPIPGLGTVPVNAFVLLDFQVQAGRGDLWRERVLIQRLTPRGRGCGTVIVLKDASTDLECALTGFRTGTIPNRRPVRPTIVSRRYGLLPRRAASGDRAGRISSQGHAGPRARARC